MTELLADLVTRELLQRGGRIHNMGDFSVTTKTNTARKWLDDTLYSQLCSRYSHVTSPATLVTTDILYLDYQFQLILSLGLFWREIMLVLLTI